MIRFIMSSSVSPLIGSGIKASRKVSRPSSDNRTKSLYRNTIVFHRYDGFGGQCGADSQFVGVEEVDHEERGLLGVSWIREGFDHGVSQHHFLPFILSLSLRTNKSQQALGTSKADLNHVRTWNAEFRANTLCQSLGWMSV
jgi:hypothetical protein